MDDIVTKKNGLIFTPDFKTVIGVDETSSEFTGKVPLGTQKIGEEAFSCCNLTFIDIPDTVTEIGANAFCNCPNLERVHLPVHLEEFPPYLFYCCTSLKEIPFRGGITVLPECVAYGCSSVTAIVLPGSVEKICTNAFSNCQNLRAIVLSANLKEIEPDIIVDCPNLSHIRVPEENTYFRTDENFTVLYKINDDGSETPVFEVPKKADSSLPGFNELPEGVNPSIIDYDNCDSEDDEDYCLDATEEEKAIVKEETFMQQDEIQEEESQQEENQAVQGNTDLSSSAFADSTFEVSISDAQLDSETAIDSLLASILGQNKMYDEGDFSIDDIPEASEEEKNSSVLASNSSSGEMSLEDALAQFNSGSNDDEESAGDDKPVVEEEPLAEFDTNFDQGDTVEAEEEPVAAEEEIVTEDESAAAEEEIVSEDEPAVTEEEVATEGEPAATEEESISMEDEPVATEEEVAIDEETPAVEEESVAEEDDGFNFDFPVENSVEDRLAEIMAQGQMFGNEIFTINDIPEASEEEIQLSCLESSSDEPMDLSVPTMKVTVGQAADEATMEERLSQIMAQDQEQSEFSIMDIPAASEEELNADRILSSEEAVTPSSAAESIAEEPEFEAIEDVINESNINLESSADDKMFMQNLAFESFKVEQKNTEVDSEIKKNLYVFAEKLEETDLGPKFSKGLVALCNRLAVIHGFTTVYYFNGTRIDTEKFRSQLSEYMINKDVIYASKANSISGLDEEKLDLVACLGIPVDKESMENQDKVAKIPSGDKLKLLVRD